MKLLDALNKAKEKLLENAISEREARLLLAFVLKVRKEELIKFDEITDEQFEKYMQVINERCNGKPYAYIVGHKEFMGLDFIVNENVLIPRDDTEVIVQSVLSKINKDASLKICDMCTGSGCIAISLAKEVEKSGIADYKIVAVDKSEKALEVAKENATRNNANVEFVLSDLFDNLEEKEFDIIVSNPPYIKTKAIKTLQKEVKDNEPNMALDGGEDGLYFYNKIIHQAKHFLKANGIICFEIGFDQANEVTQILNSQNFKNIEVIKDLSGNDRVVIASLN